MFDWNANNGTNTCLIGHTDTVDAIFDTIKHERENYGVTRILGRVLGGTCGASVGITEDLPMLGWSRYFIILTSLNNCEWVKNRKKISTGT